MSTGDDAKLPDNLPTGDLPGVDLSQLEQALTSSRSQLGYAAPAFRLVREVGRKSEPPLVEPLTLAVSHDDRILVLDQISPTEYQVLRFNTDGDCEGVSARIPRDEREGLKNPTSLSVNEAGEMFVTDGDLNAIVKFSSDGRWLEAYRSAGNDGGSFHNPRDLDLDGAGKFLVADSYNDRVVLFSTGGNLERAWSEFTNPLTGESEDSLYEPCSVCAASDGTVYIVDANNQRVLAFREGELISEWSGSGLFEFPSEVRLTPDEQILLIGDRGNMRVRKFRVAPGLQGESGCLGTLSLISGSQQDIAGGGDIDVLSSGFVTLVNPQRQAIAIVDFLEGVK